MLDGIQHVMPIRWGYQTLGAIRGTIDDKWEYQIVVAASGRACVRAVEDADLHVVRHGAHRVPAGMQHTILSIIIYSSWCPSCTWWDATYYIIYYFIFAMVPIVCTHRVLEGCSQGAHRVLKGNPSISRTH
jgi:hypothetical protein